MTRWRIDSRHQDDLNLALGLLFPAVSGLLLFGWRCVGVWALIIVGATAARVILSRFRTWIATPGMLSLLVQCVVVSLFVPATLFDVDRSLLQPDARWPALLAVGAFLALADWAVRRFGRGRAQAAVLTAALLTLAVPWLVDTRRVLRPQQLGAGDILDVRTEERSSGTAEPWVDLRPAPAPVLETPPAAAALQDFVDRRPPPGRTNQTVARLLGDDLPPLEDLVIGGHPAAIGRGSLVALLIGGLFLVYRGVTPLRVPALALLACYATLVVLPLPAGVGGGNTRRWLFERDPRVGWAAGLTLVHYLLASSALPVAATFLATRPDVRPAGRGAAALFAVTFGLLA
ncbi:MAG TPA: RnfABCDGE type electron transport complex subunit D, partial [Tepidisphaeraceae bacterium]